MDEINPAELLAFIAKAHRHTYAAPKEVSKQFKCATPILPGHKDYEFTDGPWVYHDSYAGVSWAPGSEEVSRNGKPTWRMSYQGQTVELPDEVEREFSAFLKKALMNFDDKVPFRGPAQFKDGDWEYTFNFEGDYSYFKGREAIRHKGLEVFFQDVMGELIK